MGPMSTIRLHNRLGLEVHEMVHPKNNAVAVDILPNGRLRMLTMYGSSTT